VLNQLIKYTSSLVAESLELYSTPAAVVGDKPPHIYIREHTIDHFIKTWDQFKG